MFTQDIYNAFAPVLAQALTARPTRAALAYGAPDLTPFPDVEQALKTLDGVKLDVEHAGGLAPGSLGFACRTFWLGNCLKPLVFSIPPAESPSRKLWQRRVLFHDLLHVLLGFDANPAGQLGVFAFVAAQRYCPQFDWAARDLAQLYMTTAPWARDEFADAEYRGRQLGLRTPRLLTLPLEQEWSTPLVALRDRLNIRKARTLRSIPEAPPALAATRLLSVEPSR